MIPRRRNHEETNGGATADGSNGTSTEAAAAAVAASSRKGGRNTRFVCTMVLLVVALAWVSQQETNSIKKDASTSGNLGRDYHDARTKYQKSNSDGSRYTRVDNYKRSDTEPSGKFVLKEEHEFKPAIAWLMSFPNSGTSYTMTSVAKATNRSFATNYGREVLADDEPESLSIYPRRPEGPYWPGMSGKMNSPRELPDTYVITKTHCGSRCSECGPDEYIETRDEFLRRCTAGHGFYSPGKQRREYDVEYPHERVGKAIHLYRNPMHNAIARFHMERKHWIKKNKTQLLEERPDTAEGLSNWCKYHKERYYLQDKTFFGKGKIPEAPCHGEFYKWTQWHNRATEVIDFMRSGGNDGLRREIPVLKLFYEDYDLRFNETKTAMLRFLELDEVQPFREFTSRKDYGSYFNTKQLVQIKQLVKSVATKATWADIRHYFQDVPDE